MSDKSVAKSARGLLGTAYEHWRDHGLPATAKKVARVLYYGPNQPAPEPPASPALFFRKSCPALTPLSTYYVPRTRPRLNLVLDRLAARNPRLRVVRTSATNGEGLDEWIAWIEAGLAAARARRAAGLRA